MLYRFENGSSRTLESLEVGLLPTIQGLEPSSQRNVSFSQSASQALRGYFRILTGYGGRFGSGGGFFFNSSMMTWMAFSS